jgi:hypothetical protein
LTFFKFLREFLRENIYILTPNLVFQKVTHKRVENQLDDWGHFLEWLIANSILERSNLHFISQQKEIN